MTGILRRRAAARVGRYLEIFPAVALLGPRQCGKSTLAREYLAKRSDAVYLDLERPRDLQKLHDPEIFFSAHADRLVCIDEVQRRPDLFPVLRGILDKQRRPGQLLLLGSASRDLLRQSSESLAGRIGYIELTPFLLNELTGRRDMKTLRRRWLRGGFPASYLARSDGASDIWREEFIRTFLEHDLPQLGIKTPAPTMRRFWQMCAHASGQLLNASKLGNSLGVSHPTIRNYLDSLEQTFVVRLLPPFVANLKKRLVKSPKLYVRDSGLLASLLAIDSFSDLLGHPAFGASWEGLVIEHVLQLLGDRWKASFYRSQSGNEFDLVVERGQRRFAIECKASSAPTVTKGFHAALAEMDIERAWVIAPINESWDLAPNVRVAGLYEALREIAAARKAGSRRDLERSGETS